MEPLIFKLIGAIGLVLITIGVLTNDAFNRNALFSVGGMGLFIYSLYLKDPIFIPLQIIFTLASIWEIHSLKKKKNNGR